MTQSASHATRPPSPDATASPGAYVVTGGSRGIGAEIARQLARAGGAVVIAYRTRHAEAAAVVDDITSAGGRARAIAADIGSEADIVRLFRAIDAEFGTVVGLVNNAVVAGPPCRLDELDTQNLEEVFRTNVFGPFLCAREAAKRMSVKNGGGGGAIVSLSSIAAIKSAAPGRWVHFSATKAALETMSRGLAAELAPDHVRVNVVRCGVIGTETRRTQPPEYLAPLLATVPMARMGEPAEVAAAVRWLLSADAAYVTGAVLDVGGGL